MVHRRSLFIVPLFFFCSFLFGCDKRWDSVSSDNPTYKTAHGTVTRIDDYPVFTLHYTSDYKFDAYLETGVLPNVVSNDSDSKNYCCTCFSAFGDENLLLGRNYDWPEPSTCYVLFTDPPEGYSSISTVDLSFFNYEHDESPDFAANQNTLRILPYFPFDGMNEMGVAVGMNAVPEARSPYDASRVTIGELQAIRLILDYAGSTGEAISLIQQYNVRMEEPPIHYIIADSSGHSVIIEFVEGEMEIIENTGPWQVTTNFVIKGLGSPEEAPCWRFRTASETLRLNNGLLSNSGAFDLLQEVSVSHTRWSTVFNLRTGEIQTAMDRDYENLNIFQLR